MREAIVLLQFCKLWMQPYRGCGHSITSATKHTDDVESVRGENTQNSENKSFIHLSY